MKTKLYFLTFLLLISFSNLFAQNINTYFKKQKTVSFQKLYIHTDREFYFTSDTIWFAAYLVDGDSHKLINESCNLYVNLVAENGRIIKNEIFPLENGSCSGWIPLLDSTIIEGNYLFRTFTDYALNFGNDGFFTKPISISKVKNSFELGERNSENFQTNNIDISFLPEGGFLLADKINRVAFKVVNEFGKEVSISGTIKDFNNKEICSFKTNYKGMGSFFFIPEKNKKYNVEIENYPDLEIDFPEVLTKGEKLMVGKISNNQINVNILTSEQNPKSAFYIAVLHRGKELFNLETSNYKRLKTIRINTRHFKEGINRIVLLNKDFQPLSERLVYIDKNETIDLKVELNKSEFSTREKVNLTIIDNPKNNKANNSQLSIVVLNENAVNSTGISQNIKSYLLLDSELKGTFFNPANYFVNDTVSSETKLDLLMLTNGWRNYLWNNIKKDSVDLKYRPRYGLDITGTVKNKNKYLSNTEVTLSLSTATENYLYFTNTNLIGNFYFNNIAFYDSAVFILQSNSYKLGWNTKLEINKSEHLLPQVNNEALNRLKVFSDIPLLLYRLQYYNQLNLKKFIPDYYTQMIDQVNIKAKKLDNDEHFRMYASPNNSLKIDDRDHVYANVFQYLAARVPGVKVSGIKVTIRQAPAFGRADNHGFYRGEIGDLGYNSQSPLFLLDGFMVDAKTLSMLSIKDIDKVEILKGAVAGIFGGLGEYGVVSVLTKKDSFHYYGPDEVPGTVHHRIKGFEKYRKFYSPKYSPENIESEKPDYRTTLYWNPSVILENGEAEISFFTSDDIARFKVFIEGITENGRICLGETTFEINSNHR